MKCKVTMRSGRVYFVEALNYAHANASAISMALQFVGPDALTWSEMDVASVEVENDPPNAKADLAGGSEP
jgi:hypothetical protein